MYFEYKLYYNSDERSKSTPNAVYDILKIESLLGCKICDLLPFLDAFTDSNII